MALPAQQPTAQQARTEVVDLCNSPLRPSAKPWGPHTSGLNSTQDIADAAAKDSSPMDITADEQPIECLGKNNAVAAGGKALPGKQDMHLGVQQGSYAQASSCGPPSTQADARLLTMKTCMTGSADPYWQGLSDMIVQGSISSQEQAQELKALFDESNLHKWQGHVPAYVLSGWSSQSLSHRDVL